MDMLIYKFIVRYCRDWPLIWRLIPSIQRKSKKFSGKDIPQITGTRYGFKMHINVGDFIGRHIYLHGDYEPGVSRMFSKILQQGSNIIDIGANIGYFSLLSSSIVGQKGKVFSFEASPSIYNNLKNNLTLNNANNVYASSNAIGDEEGEVEFFEANELNLGISSLRNLGEQASKKVRVKMITLDSYITDFPTIDLIKIDVEGAEMKVLKGMELLIDRDLPFIIFEVTDHMLKELGSSRIELLDWLKEKGYDLHQLTNKTIAPISEEEVQFNAFAVPKNKAQLVPALA
jgi:FkbM family methyltransferase